MVRHRGIACRKRKGKRMRRFFVDPENIGEKYIYLTEREDLHHMRKVLRLRPLDELDISDGSQWEYHVRVEKIEEKKAVLQILDKQKFAREPELKVTLYQGIPKGAKMEEIIQKTVELGVSQIVPVFMSRTIVMDKGNFKKKLDRWQKISEEAAKQCRRGVIPPVREAIDFSSMLPELSAYDRILFPYENEEERTIKDCLRNPEMNRKPGSLSIVIGPEGGFSDKEALQLDEAGAERASLGKRILRTETAGPAALAMVMYELELPSFEEEIETR